MKHGKNLKRWMKVLLKESRLNPDNWLYIKDLPGELTLVHRNTGRTRIIDVDRR
jgi:hypothetical protein